MKRVLINAVMLLLPVLGNSQGTFLGNNPQAPTRIGSIDGPYAGPNILGQFLVGTTGDSLTPVAAPVHHVQTGYLYGGIIAAPGIPPGTFGYVEMVVWDETLWGSLLGGVPVDQLGRTDIVPQYFGYDFGPAFAPSFTRPAVVPIPEPSTLALGTLGLSALWLASFAHKKRK